MIPFKLIAKVLPYPFQSPMVHRLTYKNVAFYSNPHSLSNIIQNTNLQVRTLNTKSATKPSNSKQNIRSSNMGEVDPNKLTDDLKIIFQGILQRFNNHQLNLIKNLDEGSTKSVEYLRQKFHRTALSEFEKLVDVRNQTKEIKNYFITSVQTSTSECMKSIQDYGKELVQKRNAQNSKIKGQGQKNKVFLEKIFEKIKQEIEGILVKQRSEIERMAKQQSESYLQRAKLNKKDSEKWFDDNFLVNYKNDLKKLRTIVQDSGGEFCLKINDVIVRADNKVVNVEVKKKYARIQSK